MCIRDRPKILTIRTEMPNKAKGVKQKEVKMTKMTLVWRYQIRQNTTWHKNQNTKVRLNWKISNGKLRSRAERKEPCIVKTKMRKISPKSTLKSNIFISGNHWRPGDVPCKFACGLDLPTRGLLPKETQIPGCHAKRAKNRPMAHAQQFIHY